MDYLDNQEILNTAFINDAYVNLKRSRKLLKLTKTRTPKKIGKLGNNQKVKSPTARKLDGLFKNMAKQSSPVKSTISTNRSFDESIIDYSIWIQNLQENISKCEEFDSKLDEAMEIEGLEDLMKKICAIAK